MEDSSTGTTFQGSGPFKQCMFHWGASLHPPPLSCCTDWSAQSAPNLPWTPSYKHRKTQAGENLSRSVVQPSAQSNRSPDLRPGYSGLENSRLKAESTAQLFQCFYFSLTGKKTTQALNRFSLLNFHYKLRGSGKLLRKLIIFCNFLALPCHPPF